MSRTQIKILSFSGLLLAMALVFSCNKESEKNTSLESLVLAKESSSYQANREFIVPEELAKTLAERINMTVSESMIKGSHLTSRKVEDIYTINDDAGIPALYIANYSDDGFTVISADKRYVPICAVVDKGKYSKVEVPSGLIEWLYVTIDNITIIRSGVRDGIEFAHEEWLRVTENTGINQDFVIAGCCKECPNYPECISMPSIGCGDDIKCTTGGGSSGGGGDNPCGPYTTKTLGPLVTTRWGQACTYNEECPDKDCTNVCFSTENALTGCVATAMCQILRYWSNPSAQAYDYSSMSNTFGNTEVQRMMHDAGESVDMDYGCDGSGANSDDVPDAFINTFEYSSADRNGYSAGSYNTIVDNINNERPVMLDGCSARKRVWGFLWYKYSDCHAWVCDGYQESKNKCYSILSLHMNWGWNGQFNGWYHYNTWNPGSFNFQYAQDITHNIKP